MECRKRRQQLLGNTDRLELFTSYIVLGFVGRQGGPERLIMELVDQEQGPVARLYDFIEG